MSFKVEVHNLKNFSDKEKAKLTMGIRELERILGKDVLWNAVRDNWSDWECKYYVDKNGRKIHFQSWRQFKNMLLSGADKFNPKSDGDLDLYLTLYYSWKNTVGYTYPSTWWTWTNRKFFSKFNNGEIAGHVVHEYQHNMGMDHPGTNRNSVVYQFGYLVRDMINGFEYGRIVKKKPYLTRWTRFKRFVKGIF